METIVDIVGNEEGRVEDCNALQKSADPVVYQLVRVDGNGILVPATDDEVMAVENLLQDCKSKVKTPDRGQTLESSTDYGCGPCDSSKVQFKGSEGYQQVEVLEVDAEKPNTPPGPAMDPHEKIISSLVPKASVESVCQSESPEGCAKLPGGLDESKTSKPTIGLGSKPDFSMLNGEIHLDSLSVRDLQETFRATFGRETSVKDKQWLKRRIIMGLTNSCDFSTTSFVIIDNKVVKKGKEETCDTADYSVLVNYVFTSAMDGHQSPTSGDDNPIRIHSVKNGMNMQSSNLQDICGSQDASTEKRPAKRVRKPTKRYIEELSEGESKDYGAKFVSSVKQSAYDQPSAKVCLRPGHNFRLDGRCLTRKDSLGGSGIQIPYVSRIRRCRPRENFMNLMKLLPSGIGISTGLKKNDVPSSGLIENESDNKALKNCSSLGCTQEPPVAYSERCKPYKESKAIHLEREVKLKNMDSYKNDADDDVVTVPTANRGMRRKHHQPWTLIEVVKLVEGVARYGAGRWSEIKRIEFASYSYRTPVDLKDKWRNLLKASLAELPSGNGMHGSRKPASATIPAAILAQVRELADIQTLVPPSLSPSKLAGLNDSTGTVNETRSGAL